MKKSEAQALGPLILIGAVIYPFVWIYEKIGWGGIIILGGFAVAGIAYWRINASRKDEEEFNKLALHVLHNRLHPDYARKLNHHLAKKNFPRSALVRRLQILRDSIDIALTSKTRDTAESRMAEVRSCHIEINRQHAHLILQETLAAIDRVVSECEKQFSTNLYLNIADSCIEKAEKLKTYKSKEKYAALAMEAIAEGLGNPNSEKRRLEEMKKKIELFTRSLETSS